MPVLSQAGARLRSRLTVSPRPLRAVLAVAVLVLGVVILLRPTTTLGVAALLIGAGMALHGILVLVGGGDTNPSDGGASVPGEGRVSDAADGVAPVPEDEAAGAASAGGTRTSGRRASRSWRLVVGIAWVLAGAFVLVWPGLTVRMLALLVAVLLAADGVASVVCALRPGRTWDARTAGLLDGAAGLILGLLAWLWPDVTLLVVSAVLGVRLIAFALLTLWRTLRPTASVATSRPAGRRHAWRRVTASAAVLVLAVAGAALSASLRDGSPVVDDFYTAPRTVPDEPGQLIRSEPFDRGVPQGGQGWRILYTTTLADGSPAVASGIVVAPADGDGDYPVIDWAHGTTGQARQCAPSLLTEPFESGAMFVLPEILDQGWALVATDYIGLGTAGHHPYLVGEPSAHAVLDARRAAGQLAEARLGDLTAIWGHSQGGGAALWAAALAEEYAPDVPIAGVVALAPAADLPALVGSLGSITGGSVFASFVIEAYVAEYDDVHRRDYVRPGAEVTVREMASRCLSEPAVLASVLTALGMSTDPVVTSADPLSGALGRRLADNVPPATISAPLLVGQGEADSLVTPAAQQGLVARLCEGGVAVDYQSWSGLNHVPLVEAGSPAMTTVVDWTLDRFAGLPATADSC